MLLLSKPNIQTQTCDSGLSRPLLRLHCSLSKSTAWGNGNSAFSLSAQEDSLVLHLFNYPVNSCGCAGFLKHNILAHKNNVLLNKVLL